MEPSDSGHNATEISNYTLAASVAGTVLESPSIYVTLFSYVVGGIFASFGAAWQDLVWISSSTEKRQRKWKPWHGAIDPEGNRYEDVKQREDSKRERASAEDAGLVQQDESHRTDPTFGVTGEDDGQGDYERRHWGNYKEEKRKMEERTRLRKEAGGHSGDVPPYILEYAPLLHLYSKEQWWPGDMDFHLRRTVPQINFTDVDEEPTLDNLALLNRYAPYIYLTSRDDPEAHPGWMAARFNIPDQDTYKCDAPGTLIWIDKGNGTVDAFWFYFYSYNLGNVVFNVRFGNHVGDWEHSMVRFVNGEPKWMYLSQHSGGDAYAWDAMEKQGKRPVIYSGVGTHANYATAGKQEYIVPLGLLADLTDKGPIWDLTLNSRMYKYNLTNHLLLPSSNNPEAPIEWFYFDGKWGDKKYPLTDPRQYSLIGESHYSSGPLGPRWKNLARKSLCLRDDVDCIIMTRLRYGRQRWEWEADPLDGGLNVPWWAFGGLDWYLVCWFMVEWVVSVFVIRAF